MQTRSKTKNSPKVKGGDIPKVVLIVDDDYKKTRCTYLYPEVCTCPYQTRDKIP